MTPRTLAVIGVLLFLAPLVPLPVAAAQSCAPGECHVVPLYVQLESAGGMRVLSSLSGDGMPTDPGSHASGNFLAATAPLSFGLDLMRADTFNVSLSSPSNAQYVQGFVSVRARTLGGSEFELARRDFVPENSTGIPSVYDPAAPALGGLNNGLRAIDTLLGSENLPRGALAFVYTQICGNGTAYGGPASQFNSTQCRQLTGRQGLAGAFDLCGQGTPDLVSKSLRGPWRSVDNLTTRGDLEYTFPGHRLTPQVGVDPIPVVNVHVLDAPNQSSTCRNAFHDLNQTADEHGTAPTEAIRDVVGLADDFVPLLAEIANGTLPPPHQWRSFTLPANVPPSLPQDGDSFVLPSGMRLVFEARLSSVTYTATGHPVIAPILFEVGRQDAPTFLGLRAATPHAFSRLAVGAELIGVGNHTGFFSDPNDIDDYAIDVPPGWIVNATQVAGSLSFALYSPDGVATFGNGNVGALSSGGLWTLRVSDAVNPTEYGFRIDLRSPGGTPDEGGWITEGWYSGTLGPGDDSDTWIFHAWLAQRVTVALSHGSENAFDVSIGQGPSGNQLWDVQSYVTPSYEVHTGRSTITGTIAITIEREYGEGPYSFMLDLDEAGNHTNIPAFYQLYNSSAPPGRTFDTPLSAYAGGVDFGWDGQARRVEYWGGVYTTVDAWTNTTARRGDGSLLRDDKTSGSVAITIHEPDGGLNPIARGAGTMAFGPDSLYVPGGGVRRLWPDRSEVAYSLPGPPVEKLVAAPDGSMYARQGASAYRLLDHNLSVERVPAFDGLAAFDHHGHVYRVLNRTLVERYAPWSGERVVIARADQTIHDLAFWSGYLFASLEGRDAPTGWVPGGVSIVWTGMPGFDGFHPAFSATPAADVVSVGFEDEVTGVSLHPVGPLVLPGEDHVLRVRVRNEGLGPARAFEVSISLAAPSIQYGELKRVAGLASGEETVVEFAWNSAGHVGDQQFNVFVDLGDDVVESDERDNFASYTTFAFVGGVQRTCGAALAGHAFPVPVFGTNEPRDLCRVVRV